MSRQLEQALLSLMPTYGSDLPPQLLDLAGSLLAQSRHHASTLKADEEVGRLYACANIACDRLKITLDLPPIEPRPPIPPRIYKRLYTHLNNILPSSAPGGGRSGPGRVRTPNSKQKGPGSSPASDSRPLPSRATPTKEASLSRFRTTPSKGEPGTPSGKKGALAPEDEFPVWIQPVARFLCQETDCKKLSPTILAGMEAIIVPGGRKTEDEWVLSNGTALLATIYFYVTVKVKDLTSLNDLALGSDISSKINNLLPGAAIDSAYYVPQRKEILALLTRARKEVTIPDFDEGSAWHGWTNIKIKDFDEAITKVNERDWLKGDWYQAVADVFKLTQRGVFDDVDMLDDDFAAQAQVKRADTMFQDKYDYLSEAKRSDYIAWKKSILDKIESKATTVPMDIDTYCAMQALPSNS